MPFCILLNLAYFILRIISYCIIFCKRLSHDCATVIQEKAFEAIVVCKEPKPNGFRVFNSAVYPLVSFASNNRLSCGILF